MFVRIVDDMDCYVDYDDIIDINYILFNIIEILYCMDNCYYYCCIFIEIYIYLYLYA